jgi:lambda family phage portal protein
MGANMTIVEANFLDKVITYLSPKLGQERLMQRSQLALVGGYTGGKIDRASLSRYNVHAGSATTDIIYDLQTLRARSRDQSRNAPIAIGAINTTVSHVIGTGLSYTPSINAKRLGLSQEQADAWQEDVKERFNHWAISKDCDLARNLNFYEIQELTFRSMLDSGDVAIVTPLIQRAGVGQLALQIIEADRICNKDRKPNSSTLVEGVELDQNTGEFLKLHIAKKHPADAKGSNEWTILPLRGSETSRKNVLFLFEHLRPGQPRGVPFIAPIIEPLKQLQRWSDAELKAAVDSAMFSVFVKMDHEAFDSLFDDDAKGLVIDKASAWSGEMESGKAVNLLPGESIESPTPGRPNPAFDPFWQAMVRQIGMTLGMPFEVLTMHFQSSYSAARAALLMAWKMYRKRRDFISTNLCQPIFELWLENEVVQGRIRAQGFFSSPIIRAAWCGAVWTGDGPGSIDPAKEVAAAKARVELEISTLEAESILHDGVGFDVKHKQRAKEMAMQKRDGTYIPPAGAAAAPEPKNKNQDD